MPAQRSTQHLLVSAGPSKDSSSLAGGLLHSLRNWSHIHQLLWYYIFNILLCSQFFNVLKKLWLFLFVCWPRDFWLLSHEWRSCTSFCIQTGSELLSVSKELKIWLKTYNRTRLEMPGDKWMIRIINPPRVQRRK